MENKTVSVQELEETRIARFANLQILPDAFNIKELIPNGGLLVRKVIGRGIIKDPLMRPAITIEHPFSTTLVEIPPGQGAPLHAHKTEEVFFILEGEMTFFWGVNEHDNRVSATAYDTVSMPLNVFRGFVNNTEKTARMLVTVAGTSDETMNSVTHSPDLIAKAAALGIQIS